MIRCSSGEADQGQTWCENVFAEAGGWVLTIEGIYEQSMVGLYRNCFRDLWKRRRVSHLRRQPAAFQNLSKGCFWRNHWHSLAGLSSNVKIKNVLSNGPGPTVIMVTCSSSP